MRSYAELKAEVEKLQCQMLEAKQREQSDLEFEPLAGFKRSTYSQFGEDGIISEILRRIGSKTDLDKWCAEFGAWDGVHLSNTCKLIRESAYNAVLIEGNPSRVQDLEINFPQDHVHKISRFVNFEGVDTLDSIFSGTPIPFQFDFLSIDVDGVDYHIFESLKIYRPKVVCIEFNPAIPNAVDYVQARDFKIKQGSSALAITRLAKQKGYALAASTQCNLIFIDSEYLSLVCHDEATLEAVNEQGNNPQYIFAGYDGTILSNRDSIVLNWHGVPIPMSKVQFLPMSLRKFYGDYGNLRRMYLSLFVALHLPKQIIKYRHDVKRRLVQELRTRFRPDH